MLACTQMIIRTTGDYCVLILQCKQYMCYRAA